MPGMLSLTYLDYSREKASFTLNTVTPTAANLGTLTTQVNNLVAAIDGITDGVLNKRILTVKVPGSAVYPASPEAQREKKWLVSYTDVTTNLAAGVTNPLLGASFTSELPTALLASNLQVNSDYAELSGGAMGDFVTAFEAFARSPSGGAVQVNSVKYVGRNL